MLPTHLSIRGLWFSHSADVARVDAHLLFLCKSVIFVFFECVHEPVLSALVVSRIQF
jgi:hypothetical protein